MKKSVILIMAFLYSLVIVGQAPQLINYQAIARDTNGNPLKNRLIGLQFTIHDGSGSGSVVYQESDTATTNVFGLFNVNIGTGTNATGTISAVNWGDNQKYMEVGLDVTGGTNYADMGNGQLVSVPYALYAGSNGGWSLTGNSGTSSSTNFIGTTDTAALQFKVNNNPAGLIDAGNDEIYFGYQAGASHNGSQYNTGIGTNALYDNQTGISNVGIGQQALYTCSNGLNTAVGAFACYNNQGAIGNTALGYGALYQNSVNGNTAVGFRTMYLNNSGTGNVAIGYNTLYSDTNGSDNTAVGYASLTAAYASANTAIGSNTLIYTTGGGNTAVGYYAMELNSSGFYNTGVGYDAMMNNDGGASNTALGYYALGQNSSGNSNTAVGYAAGYTNQSGTGIAVFGTGADVTVDGLTNATAIGNEAKVGASNCLVLGATGSPYQVNVGIGTTTPAFPLDIEVANTGSISNYGYLNSSGGTGSHAGLQNPAISVYAPNGRMVCVEFDAISDKRIKKVVDISNSVNDLNTLDQLQVTDFKYKDEIAQGSQMKKGFIAQQVEGVYPEAVSQTTNFIPDIYAKPASCKYDHEKHELSIRMDARHNLNKGDKVRIITSSGNHDVTVERVNSKNEFTIAGWNETAADVFVFGKQVNDFRVVDYDRIYTLNVSATQELIKRVAALEQENEQLELQMQELKKCVEENGLKAEK